MRATVIVVVGAFAAAFAVAAAVERAPANFAALPPVAVVRDRDGQALWTIRLAPAAHQIAADAAAPMPPPPGRAYQLWLTAPDGVHSLGLLPNAGRKVTAEIPAVLSRLAAGAELIVTLEPARGSGTGQPSGDIVSRAHLPQASPGG